MSDGYLLSLGTFGAEAHFLAGQGINGLAAGNLRSNGSTLQDLVVANGGVTLANPVANHETLTPNFDVNTGGVTVLLNQQPAATAPLGSVAASPEPSYIGNAFTITASVPGAGSVNFTIDNTPLGVVPVGANNQASIAGPTTLALGAHSVVANYVPLNSAPTVQFATTHNVVLSPTTVVLTPTTPLTTYFGLPADGTFAVSVLNGTFPATGKYTLFDNGVAVAICTALPLPTACPYGNPVLLDAGPHAFTIGYLGDAYNAPSTSVPVLYTILPDLTSASPITSSLNPAPQAANVVFTVTITANAAQPTGYVSFLDGQTAIGTGPLVANPGALSSTASISTSTLAVGGHTITASYAGNLDFNPVTAGPLSQIITPVQVSLPSVTLLHASANPAIEGQPVTFTASVVVPGPFAIEAPGTVTFTLDGASAGAPVTLDQYASAAITLSQLSPGSHTLAATYSGYTGTGYSYPRPLPSNPSILPSSTSLVEIIEVPLPSLPPGFTLTVTPNPVSVGVGRTANFLVTVTPVSGFLEPVVLSCANLPTEAACTFFGPNIPPGGGAVDLQLATAAPHDCGDPTHPYFLGSQSAPGLFPRALPFMFAGAILFGLRRRRRLVPVLMLALALALSSLSGCGHCTDLGTRPANYTFTVIGTAQGASASQAVKLTVTIP